MEQTVGQLKKYVRAANYISAAQIYLKDNFLLERPLTFDDIKPRLLGHWGTCPGINFIYAGLNLIAKRHNKEMLFVLGPGHGFPALQANLFIEGTLGEYYPEALPNKDGLGYLIKNFSWPYGFPSHSNPGTPGVILEGGELGYSLSTAYGAALDNPNLTVACLVGDGEAETGPSATAWHLNKFIDPKTNGAVLPILHLNGYKISGPTIFGRMSNRELKSLFYGYGYNPHIIEGRGIFEKLVKTMEKCVTETEALRSNAVRPPRFPMIILKTPKGWTGVKRFNGEKIEGNFLSHQVVLPNAKTKKTELKALEKWLASYRFGELFDPVRGFSEDVRSIIPESELRIGNNRQCFGGDKVCRDLMLPEFVDETGEAAVPGASEASSMRAAGSYLKKVIEENELFKNFRVFSPDETYSNRLDEIFEATSRAFVWPSKPWDRDIAPSGRVIEMLSEHSLQGLMQGYVLTGRHAVFPSYEAFMQIVSSMADQYAKFIRVAREIPWRGHVSSLNYILTSPGWRQEHNGFSHQNPGFIDSMLQKHGCFVHVYFPPDRNSTLAVLRRCLASKEEINLIVAGKDMEPEWLPMELAAKELERGLMIWDFASDPDPDIVVASAGDYLTKEALAAVSIAKEEAPDIRIRFVNILELSALGVGNAECRAEFRDFANYFTEEKPVIVNFHGYPETLKQILFDQRGAADRFSIHGYIENGSTTTPFDMHVRNKTSRYHLAAEILTTLAKRGRVPEFKASDFASRCEKIFAEHGEYIRKEGVDPDFISLWKWHSASSSRT